MRLFTTVVIACLALGSAAAAAPAPRAPPMSPPKTFMSSAEVQGLIAQGAAARKEGVPLQTFPIVGLLPYVANLEYRTGVGPAAVHLDEAEMFYVIDGSGTLVTGGRLVGETRPNPDNLRGTAVEGGSVRPVAKGDFFIVPEGVPHWYSRINGTLVLMSIHVPHQMGNPR